MGQSQGSFLAGGYGSPCHSSQAPYMLLPSFGVPAPPLSSHHQNNNNNNNLNIGGCFDSQDFYGDPRAEPSADPPPSSLSSTTIGSPNPPAGALGEEGLVIAETKLCKNIRKLTATLSQVPGLEQIRWKARDHLLKIFFLTARKKTQAHLLFTSPHSRGPGVPMLGNARRSAG